VKEKLSLVLIILGVCWCNFKLNSRAMKINLDGCLSGCYGTAQPLRPVATFRHEEAVASSFLII